MLCGYCGKVGLLGLHMTVFCVEMIHVRWLRGPLPGLRPVPARAQFQVPVLLQVQAGTTARSGHMRPVADRLTVTVFDNGSCVHPDKCRQYTVTVRQTQCYPGILCSMSEALLDAVEINPAGTVRACIIWLHGLGADGHDFEPLIPQLGLVDTLGVRVVLPHAPHRPVTINAGSVMPAWYDILAPDFSRGQDSAGIRQSEQQLQLLIQREIDSGIPAENILLAGFSQGGAVVLHTGLRYPQALAGILALSTYLPLADLLAAEHASVNDSIPIMMAHGRQDPVVPLSLAQQSRDILQQQGYQIDWHSYPMQHALCPEELRHIRDWLLQRLAPPAV